MLRYGLGAKGTTRKTCSVLETLFLSNAFWKKAARRSREQAMWAAGLQFPHTRNQLVLWSRAKRLQTTFSFLEL